MDGVEGGEDLTYYRELIQHTHIHQQQERPISIRQVRFTKCKRTKNLNHPLIKNLYILVQHNESVRFLQNIDFKNSSKLVIVLSENGITVKDCFTYIAACLQGEIAMLTNSDITVGEGFEKVDPALLRENKLMYALTRHSTYDKYGICDVKLFVGCVDSFLFYVRQFKSTDFNLLSISQRNEPGLEQVIMYMFHREFGWKVINPCKILKTYHQHQVPAKNYKGKPINMKKVKNNKGQWTNMYINSYTAPHTDQLF